MSFLNHRHCGVVAFVLTLLSSMLPACSNAQTKDPRCNWHDASGQIQYPQNAVKNMVDSGETEVHGEVKADGRIAIGFIESTDPVFFEPALVGVGSIRCTSPAGSPFSWPVGFRVDDGTTTATKATLTRKLSDAAGSERRIVLLLPQGIDPSNDHDGLNELSRRLNSALGARICEDLQRRDIGVIAILDQRPVGIQEKLEAYAGSLQARHILVVTVETVTVEDELQVRYRLQYSDDDLLMKSGRLEAVVPTGTVARTYKIKGSKSGPTNVLVESISENFLKGLDDDGRLKGLVAH